MWLIILIIVVLMGVFSSFAEGGKACAVRNVTVHRLNEFIYEYELQLREPEKCSPDRTWSATLKPCDRSSPEEETFTAKRKDSFCPSIVGCLRMKVGKRSSRKFHSLGDIMSLDIFFGEFSFTGLRLIFSTEHGPLIARWDLHIFNCTKFKSTNDNCNRNLRLEKKFSDVGNGTSLEIQYSFQENSCYYFDLYPKVSDPRCQLFRTDTFTSTKGCKPRRIPPVQDTKGDDSWINQHWGIILSLIMMVLVVGCALAAALKYHARSFTMMSRADSETAITEGSPVSVLLLYAEEDDQHLQQIDSLSRRLQQEISAKVYSIYDMQDPAKVADPNLWLMDKLSANAEMIVLVIWSPTMTLLYNSLFSEKLSSDMPVPKVTENTKSREDVPSFKSSFKVQYLTAALRQILVENSAPVYGIRFHDKKGEQESVSLRLLSNRWFVFPQHWEYLRVVLKR